MKRIALISVDSKRPNLALMKIAAHHRSLGNHVEFWQPFEQYDMAYLSKIFNFTPDFPYVLGNISGPILRGGTGYDIHSTLPAEIDSLQPDYSLYPDIDSRTSYGFLTRGCPNKCSWCVVPQKEGAIRSYMDIDDITLNGRRPYAVLMDNNILALPEYAEQQLKKIIDRRYHVDFNQALDARLVDADLARLLAQVKWIGSIVRFGCDTPKQIAECERAMQLMADAGYNGQWLLYCMVHGSIEECYERLSHWRRSRFAKKSRIVAQPYRDPYVPAATPPLWQRDMSRWANRREFYVSCDFADFSPRKGFRCSQYFNTQP